MSDIKREEPVSISDCQQLFNEVLPESEWLILSARGTLWWSMAELSREITVSEPSPEPIITWGCGLICTVTFSVNLDPGLDDWKKTFGKIKKSFIIYMATKLVLDKNSLSCVLELKTWKTLLCNQSIILSTQLFLV